MSITKAEILAEVNDRLNRSETDIDDQIRAVLYAISERGNFLSKEYTQDTVADTDYYAFPDNFKELKAIRLKDSDDQYLAPLEGPIQFKDFLNEVAANAGSAEPERFAIFNGYFRLQPTPDAVYEMTLFCHIFHPTSLTTILFEEIFRETIYAGACFEVAKKYGLPSLSTWATAFEIGIQARLDNLYEKKAVLKNDFHDV